MYGIPKSVLHSLRSSRDHCISSNENNVQTNIQRIFAELCLGAFRNNFARVFASIYYFPILESIVSSRTVHPYNMMPLNLYISPTRHNVIVFIVLLLYCNRPQTSASPVHPKCKKRVQICIIFNHS